MTLLGVCVSLLWFVGWVGHCILISAKSPGFGSWDIPQFYCPVPRDYFSFAVCIFTKIPLFPRCSRHSAVTHPTNGLDSQTGDK